MLSFHLLFEILEVLNYKVIFGSLSGDVWGYQHQGQEVETWG